MGQPANRSLQRRKNLMPLNVAGVRSVPLAVPLPRIAVGLPAPGPVVVVVGVAVRIRELTELDEVVRLAATRNTSPAAVSPSASPVTTPSCWLRVRPTDFCQYSQMS